MISVGIDIDKYRYVSVVSGNQRDRPDRIAYTGAAMTTESITDDVRDRYAAAARAILDPSLGPSDAASSCCAPDGGQVFGEVLYDAGQRAALPETAVLASLGCGNPTAVAELGRGETVLDLGSGGGIDVLLSATRVGPDGFVYGLDMTDEMLDLARRNADAAGATNVEFRKGRIESIPLGDGSVDVVISNCVVNLSTDKGAVLSEIARVLRPGGRVGISDVVAEDRLSPAERAERGSFVGCIAGALSFSEYGDGLAAAGLVDIDVTPTHAVGDGLHGAIIKARKPADWSASQVRNANLPRPTVALPMAVDGETTSGSGCCGDGCGCS
jgi:arsenite methyltransferase